MQLLVDVQGVAFDWTCLILLEAPGMGKTLTARLIASQSSRSFYSISPGDVLSGAVGGSV